MNSLDALATLAAERGRLDMAGELFRRVLSLKPGDLTASTDLGILLAKQGQVEKSESLLKTAYARNQDVDGLAMDLARIECALGQPSDAHATLETILIYDPGLQDARAMLWQTATCGGSAAQ